MFIAAYHSEFLMNAATINHEDLANFLMWHTDVFASLLSPLVNLPEQEDVHQVDLENGKLRIRRPAVVAHSRPLQLQKPLSRESAYLYSLQLDYVLDARRHHEGDAMTSAKRLPTFLRLKQSNTTFEKYKA
ncbi:hypothetical protein DFH28DRAFT_1230352 [Melampsora americana]|nr:hypothetical protein DFH28DRAFT_1230352 [Melampsora americana]